EVMPAIGIGQEVHHGPDLRAALLRAQRGIEPPSAKLRLARRRDDVFLVCFEYQEAFLQDGKRALEATLRNQGKIVERSVVFRTGAVLGAHDGDDRQVGTGTAVLAFIAATVEEAVGRIGHAMMIKDMASDPVGKRFTETRGQKRVGPLVANAGYDEARNGSFAH